MSKTCQNCGNSFDDNVSICPRCGMQYVDVQYSNQQYQQAPYQQPQYQQPYPQQNYGVQPNAPEPPMSVGQWVGTILLTTCLGTISLILLFIWAFSNSTPASKKNYCRAMLIVEAIGLGLLIVFMIIIFSVLAANGEGIAEFFKEIEHLQST